MATKIQITGFLASNQWCTKFLRWKNLALWQKKKIAQKFPEDLDQKITNFHSFVIKSRRKLNYKLAHICNMDKTPVWFDLPSARTVNGKWERRENCVGQHNWSQKNHSSQSYLCAWQMEQSLSLWWSLNRRSCQKRTFHPEFSYTVIWRGGWMKLEWSCG